MRLKGVITALITPFDDNGGVNYGKFEELIEFQINNGANGIVILGTTGESPTITEEEKEKIISVGIKAVSGRIPVIVGAGSNDTERAVENCKKAASLGADALLVLTPYYNKTNTEGMINHFSFIADNADAPVIIYNVPSRTGCSVDIAALGVLAQHKNIIGLKEASGNISYAAKAATFINDDFSMFCGNDDIILPMMSLGAAGAISVASNIIPAEIASMIGAFEAGEHAVAVDTARKYLPFICALFDEVNPIPVKEAMNILGFGVGGVRMPLFRISGAARKKLTDAMRICGLYDGCRG